MTRTRRTSARIRLAIAAALAVLLIGAIVYEVGRPGVAQITVQARFRSAPGLYDGNQVRVLGMPVGRVTSIKPGPDYVTVTLTVPKSVQVPANAQALILAPNVVNDRYVELTPSYLDGPVLANGAVIPTTRTGSPLSVDEIIGSLDQLSKALGPQGANANGSLSSLISSAARSFGGNGPAVNSTLHSLGAAFGALSAQSPNLKALLDNLGNLTQKASQYTQSYESFAGNLATVSTNLAADDQSLGGALSNLQQALGQLAAFVQYDGSSLGASVANLKVFAAAVASNQAALGQLFGALPVAAQNLNAAFNHSAPGGPALRARLDPMGGSKAFSSSVCGSALLRLLLLVPGVNQGVDNQKTDDLACGVNGVLQNLPVPPGAPSGPNLSLQALVGGAG